MEQSLIIYFFVGLLFMIISIPFIKEKVKINNWFGIRLPSTMKSEKVWFAANKKAGINLFILGLLTSLICFLFYFSELVSPIFSFISVTLLILIGTIVVSIKSGIYANQLYKSNYG